MSDTYWNGQPCRAEKVLVRVAKSPKNIWWYTWWCSGLEGTIRKAVAVYYFDDRVVSHLLDNEDGSGWAKVTEGYGSSNWPHRGLPLASEIVTEEVSDG